MVKIQNRMKSIEVLNIPCPAGCDGTGCLCSVVTTTLHEELPDGEKGIRVLERRLPGAVTFLAGETRMVPDWVADSGPVKDAVAKGRLRLVKG